MRFCFCDVLVILVLAVIVGAAIYAGLAAIPLLLAHPEGSPF